MKNREDTLGFKQWSKEQGEAAIEKAKQLGGKMINKMSGTFDTISGKTVEDWCAPPKNCTINTRHNVIEI